MVKTRKQRNVNDTKIVLSKKKIYKPQNASSQNDSISNNSSKISKKPKKFSKKKEIIYDEEFEEEYDPNEDYIDENISSAEISENEIIIKKRLTRRQLYNLKKKNNEEFIDILKFQNYQVSKKRGKKKKVYASLEEELKAKKESEIKRKELMMKNLEEKMRAAIDRILNVRDNKKIMKNNNFNKKKKVAKFFDKSEVFFKYVSDQKFGDFLGFQNNFFFDFKKGKGKFLCEVCKGDGRYRVPISCEGFCSVKCFKVLKEKLNK